MGGGKERDTYPIALYAPTSNPPRTSCGLLLYTRRTKGKNTRLARVKRLTAETDGSNESLRIFTQPKLVP